MLRKSLDKIKKNIEKVITLNKLKRMDIQVHPDFHIGNFTTIEYGTNINGPGFIRSNKNGPVKIGKYCAIAHNLRIITRNHYTGYKINFKIDTAFLICPHLKVQW